MTAAAKKPRWLSVVGFEGLYEVSSLGVVRSLSRQTGCGILGGRILTPSVSRNGYHRVTLSKEGATTRASVHRIVLTAFTGQPNGREARHLNGVRSDNRLSNLAWGTRSENARDRVTHGTQYDNRGERHGNTKLTNADALAIRAAVASGERQSSVALRFETSAQTVGRIAHGKGWKHLGEMVDAN